jgi:hypothetical protein
VRCHHRGSHAEIVLDLDIRLAGKPDIELEVGASSFACVPVTLSELQMAGTLRIVFSPLCTTWPCFANLSVGFVRQPLVDCRLAVATNAFDVMSMPGIADALHRVLSVSIASSFTWPNFVTVPLVDGHEIDAEDFALNFGMAGILELEIVRATGLRRGGHAGGGSGGARSMQTTALSMLAGLSPLQPYLTVEKSGANPTRYPTVKRVSHGACAFNGARETRRRASARHARRVARRRADRWLRRAAAAPPARRVRIRSAVRVRGGPPHLRLGGGARVRRPDRRRVPRYMTRCPTHARALGHMRARARHRAERARAVRPFAHCALTHSRAHAAIAVASRRALPRHLSLPLRAQAR